MQVPSVMHHVIPMVNCIAGEQDQTCARHVRLCSHIINHATFQVCMLEQHYIVVVLMDHIRIGRMMQHK